MAYQMEQGHEPPLTEIFYAFCNSHNYCVAQRISYPVLVRLSFLVLAEEITVLFTYPLFKGTLWGIMFEILLCVAVLAGWLLLTTKGFFQPYLEWQSPETASRMQPYAASIGKCYRVGFLPWILLSLLTFGVLLLADTLPRMLVAYFRLCNHLNELTTKSEEMIK